MRTGCDVRACSAPSTGCPGIAVPPGSAHLPSGRLKQVQNQCESGRAIRLGATTLPALKDLLKIRYALTRYRTRHAIIVRNTLPGETFTWRNVYLEERLPGGTSTLHRYLHGATRKTLYGVSTNMQQKVNLLFTLLTK